MSATNAGRGIDCSVIIPDHKSCSASQCSLGSFSPHCPVWAIFSLPVQRGSTAVVATWIWGLCHSCRLEQHWSCKLYSFLFPLPGLQNNSSSERNEERHSETNRQQWYMMHLNETTQGIWVLALTDGTLGTETALYRANVTNDNDDTWFKQFKWLLIGWG